MTVEADVSRAEEATHSADRSLLYYQCRRGNDHSTTRCLQWYRCLSRIPDEVTDTGVRYTHQDLAANMWVNPIDGSHGINAVAGTTDPMDDAGIHGLVKAHMAAPGGELGSDGIYSTWRTSDSACEFIFGTSMATPLIATLSPA